MAAPVSRDQELELTIDRLAYGGNGVARLNGFVVFVRRGLPGDTVRARVTKVQRRHAEALVTEAIAAGGSSISDYVDAEGRKGFFQFSHRVYQRTGEPCVTCQTPIRRIIVTQRSSHFCPKCQKR